MYEEYPGRHHAIHTINNFSKIDSSISKLFQQYCCNLYGVVLCRLHSHELDCLFTEWRKVIRRILRLPARAHSCMLPLLVNRWPIELVVEIRIIKFFICMLYNENNMIVSLAKRCMSQALSNTGNNVSLLLRKFDMEAMSLMYDKKSLMKVFMDKYMQSVRSLYSDREIADANICIELLDARDGITLIDTLQTSDCNEIIASLCTS